MNERRSIPIHGLGMQMHISISAKDEEIASGFGHSDYKSYLGLIHKKLEIPVKKNFIDGRK